MNEKEKLEAKILEKQIELIDAVLDNWDSIDWAKTFNMSPRKEGETDLQWMPRLCFIR